MDIRQIEYFISVAKHLNFTQAAMECYIAQQALSQQISSLEKELGFKLFVRSTRNVRLTPAGRVFLDDAYQLLKLYKASIQKMKNASFGMTGTLNIGYSPAFYNSIMPVLSGIVRKNPNIGFSVSQGLSDSITKSLKSRALDIIFLASYQVAQDSDIEYEVLSKMPLCLVVNKHHRFAHKSKDKIETIANERFILMDYDVNPQIYSKIIEDCTRSGFVPKDILTVNNFETQLLLIAAGHGVALLPKNAGAHYNLKLTSLLVEGLDEKIEFCAAWVKNNKNPVLPIFIKHLQDVFDLSQPEQAEP